MRVFSALPFVLFLATVSCESDAVRSESTDEPLDPSIERTRNEIAELEAGVEEFRQQIAESMNQQAVDQMNQDELEALRDSEIELPPGVELPPRE